MWFRHGIQEGVVPMLEVPPYEHLEGGCSLQRVQPEPIALGFSPLNEPINNALNLEVKFQKTII